MRIIIYYFKKSQILLFLNKNISYLDCEFMAAIIHDEAFVFLIIAYKCCKDRFYCFELLILFHFLLKSHNVCKYLFFTL